MAGNDVVRLKGGPPYIDVVPWPDEAWPPPQYLVLSEGFTGLNMIPVDPANPQLPTLVSTLADLAGLAQCEVTWFERVSYSLMTEPGSDEAHFCRAAEYAVLNEPPQLI